jgi:hypothetical protein
VQYFKVLGSSARYFINSRQSSQFDGRYHPFFLRTTMELPLPSSNANVEDPRSERNDITSGMVDGYRQSS